MLRRHRGQQQGGSSHAAHQVNVNSNHNNTNRSHDSSGDEFTAHMSFPYGDADESVPPTSPVVSVEESWTNSKRSITNTTTTTNNNTSTSTTTSTIHQNRSVSTNEETGSYGATNTTSWSSPSSPSQRRQDKLTASIMVPWPETDPRHHFHPLHDFLDEENKLDDYDKDDGGGDDATISAVLDEPSCYTDYYHQSEAQLHRRKFPLRSTITTAATNKRINTTTTTTTRAVISPTASTPPAQPTTSMMQDRLAQVEANMRLVEDQVALHQRLRQVEECMKRRDEEMHHLRQQMEEQTRFESHAVEWCIPALEKRLMPGQQRHFFESSTFGSRACPFYLTVCVLEVPDHVPEARRPVAIFIKSAFNREHQQQQHHKHKQQQQPRNYSKTSNIFPLRLDGSSLTLMGNPARCQDKVVQVGEAIMEDASQGKGLRQFTTLGQLRDYYLQDDASVIVRATIRVPRIRTVQLETL